MTVSRIDLCSGGPNFSRIAQGFGSMLEHDIKSAGEMSEYLSACIDEGITTFDNSSVYKGGEAESVLGEVLAMNPGMRNNIQLVTKYGIIGATNTTVHMYDTTKEHIIFSAERSLKRLRTDHLDVLLMHRPDPLMDAGEVAEAYRTLKKDGKVLYFGVSNFTVSQFELIQSQFDFPLVTNEIEYNVLNMQAQDDGVLDLCQKRHISPMIYASLTGGRLFTEKTEQISRVRKALADVGEMLGGASVDQVALAWVLRHPAKGVALIGTGRLPEMESAVKADRLVLTRDQWFRIWIASQNREVP